MIAAVWIVGVEGVPHQNQLFAPWEEQGRGRKRSVRFELPTVEPEWLVERLQTANVNRAAAGTPERFTVLGLAKLTARGAVYESGPLFDPDDECKLLSDVFHRPGDGILFKVVDALALTEPFEIKHRMTVSRRKRFDLLLFGFCVRATTH